MFTQSSPMSSQLCLNGSGALQLYCRTALPQLPAQTHRSRSKRRPHRSLCKRVQAQGSGLTGPDGQYSADTAAISDGPDLFMFRNANNNLGAMQEAIKGQPSDADIKAMQDVPNRGTAFEGLYVDGSAIFGSSVLLAILLFLSLERILGLDQWLAKAKRRWKEKEEDKNKWAVYNARQRLEDTFSSSDDSSDSRK